MKCPSCGAAELVHDTRNIPYSYKGKETTIPSISGEFCSACGEGVFDDAQGDKLSELMLAFNKRINSETVAPEYIAKIRLKLGLDQKEAAELFGGGVNAFSRYETGRATPPTALIKLFQILDKYPHLIREINGSSFIKCTPKPKSGTYRALGVTTIKLNPKEIHQSIRKQWRGDLTRIIKSEHSGSNFVITVSSGAFIEDYDTQEKPNPENYSSTQNVTHLNSYKLNANASARH